tara:strand:+ start:888 stop:1190 length:303 start_codon:yes stop_codon:yes gene_type:complete
MAWQRTTKEVRPNTTTDFWECPDEDKVTIKEMLEDTGKSISFSVEISSDGLTKTKTRVFDSEASKNAFISSDFYVALEAKHAKHCTDNSTTKSKITDKEI